MQSLRTLPTMVGFLWVGLALGGNLIAVPAKFQVTGIPLSMMLQIGRAQFNWLGMAGWVLLVILIGYVVFARPGLWPLLGIPVAIFLIQQLAMMPLLEERTIQVVVGNLPDASNVHVVYVVLEFLKLPGLLGAGFALIYRQVEGS